MLVNLDTIHTLQVFRHNLPNSSFQFSRSWSDYKNGFGGTGHNFWLGNNNLHRLTAQGGKVRRDGGSYMVRVETEAKVRKSKTRVLQADYNGFFVGDEKSEYRLMVGHFLPGSTARK